MSRYTQFTSHMRYYKGEYLSDVERARRFVERRGIVVYGRLVGFTLDEPEYRLKITFADGTVLDGIYTIGRLDATEFILGLMNRARKFNKFPAHRDSYEESEVLARRIFDTQYDRLVSPKRTFLEKLRKR